jgi:hypothetical protein
MPAPKVFSRHTVTAPALRVGERWIVPELSVWSVRLPFAGLVWSRPTSVLVDGERLRIVDVTRTWQWLAWAAVVAAWLATLSGVGDV